MVKVKLSAWHFSVLVPHSGDSDVGDSDVGDSRCWWLNDGDHLRCWWQKKYVGDISVGHKHHNMPEYDVRD